MNLPMFKYDVNLHGKIITIARILFFFFFFLFALRKTDAGFMIGSWLFLFLRSGNGPVDSPGYFWRFSVECKSKKIPNRASRWVQNDLSTINS